MIKARKKSTHPLMRRACRVYLNDLNAGKAQTLINFLHACHNATQYFVDLFWARQDFSAKFTDLATVHTGRDRFTLTTRLAQALAKQAKETVRSQRENATPRKPRIRRHTVTLYYHFVTLEDFFGPGFDYAVRFIGSGAPKGLVAPLKANAQLNRRLQDGWALSKTVRLGRDGKRLWLDLLLEKPRPKRKPSGVCLGMDSNYKAGFVFSDGQQVGRAIYRRIQQFGKRQKNTFAEIDSMVGQALKQVDWSSIKTLALEDLKRVKQGKRGTFPRHLNRRLSHWLYRASAARIERICEEHGIRLEYKDPWKTSQTCHACGTWDRRNRQGDRFQCVRCGLTEHADLNAARNLERLAVAGIYGFRFPQNSTLCSNSHSF